MRETASSRSRCFSLVKRENGRGHGFMSHKWSTWKSIPPPCTPTWILKRQIPTHITKPRPPQPKTGETVSLCRSKNRKSNGCLIAQKQGAQRILKRNLFYTGIEGKKSFLCDWRYFALFWRQSLFEACFVPDVIGSMLVKVNCLAFQRYDKIYSRVLKYLILSLCY